MAVNKSQTSGRGLFITVEGGEGAGKSTQMPRIREWLEARGHDVRVTRQPGGTPLAEALRSVVLDNRNRNMSPLAELLLLFAGRAQFMTEVVRPALEADVTVLCDRFTDSTYAYQGGGRGMPLKEIDAIAQLVHGDLQPDLTLLLDLPVEQGMRRITGRGGADRFEIEDHDFFDRVRRTYLRRAADAPDRFAVVDASGDPDTVWREIREVLEGRVGRK